MKQIKSQRTNSHFSGSAFYQAFRRRLLRETSKKGVLFLLRMVQLWVGGSAVQEFASENLNIRSILLVFLINLLSMPLEEES